MLYKRLTQRVIGCCYDVHNEIGLGYTEPAYQAGLEAAMTDADIPFQSQVSIPLCVDDVTALTLVADFVVDDRVILEIKSVEGDFAHTHYIQLFSYLKATQLDIGFLINFGLERVSYDRIKFREKPVVINQNWDYLCNEQRNNIDPLRVALLDIAGDHGLGYGADTYKKLIAFLCSKRGMNVNTKPQTPVQFENKPLGKHKLNCLLINDELICTISALQEGISSYHIARNQSYLKNTNSNVGVHANYGKERLQIHGIRPPKYPPG